MITVSVCMIVKNEEKVLKRCLDSLKGLWDELIIVDTGSTDSTRDIALSYTDKVYDFKWVNDFSKARNFSIEKATCDYIYIPDADEILDEENREKFLNLKKCLLKEIDIVQMRYVNQLENGTVYNFDSEYRPKLYKRLREWTFIEPVHERVRLDPVVFESDIDIIHKPLDVHSGRDLLIFEKTLEREKTLSSHLTKMYVRELIKSGEASHLKKAVPFFTSLAENSTDDDILRLSYIVLCLAAAAEGDVVSLMKYSLKDSVSTMCSEICTILGTFLEDRGDLNEASVWYYNAYFETEAETDLKYQTRLPLEGMCRVYKALGEFSEAEKYEEELKKYK